MIGRSRLAKMRRIGTRVKTTMGISRTGTICSHIPLDKCTDGTYRGPLDERERRTWVSVKWDDGTQGYTNLCHIAPIGDGLVFPPHTPDLEH